MGNNENIPMMNLEQKCEAMSALGRFAVYYRKAELRGASTNKYYTIHEGINIRDKNVIQGTGGESFSPEMAIHDAWTRLTEKLEHHQSIEMRVGDGRRNVKWNGFMWADVQP